MVTLTEVMARWVHSWDQLVTSFPPRTTKAFERDVLPSSSKHDEHTTGRWRSTLTRDKVMVIRMDEININWDYEGNQTRWATDTTDFVMTGLISVAYLNLLSKTPNVTLSPDFRFADVFSVKRWLLTNVPYLDVSFRIRVWKYKWLRKLSNKPLYIFLFIYSCYSKMEMYPKLRKSVEP